MEVLITALAALSTLGLLAPSLHIYQLESYQTHGTLRSFGRNAPSLWGRLLPGWALALASCLLPGWAAAGAVLVSAGAALFFFFRWKKAPMKKALAYTARVKRLYGVYAAVCLILGGLTGLFALGFSPPAHAGPHAGGAFAAGPHVLAAGRPCPWKSRGNWYIRERPNAWPR